MKVAMPADDIRCQEEALRQASSLAERLSYEDLKAVILPAVHGVCLATTAAAVRVAAFATLAATAPRMDEPEAEAMLTTADRCLAVDRTAATAMCVLGLGEALSKKWGPRLTAQRILPTVSPLLVSPSLNAQQFAAVATIVHDMVRGIEKARGEGRAGANSNAKLDTAVPAPQSTPLGRRPRPGASNGSATNGSAPLSRPASGASTAGASEGLLNGTGGAPALGVLRQEGLFRPVNGAPHPPQPAGGHPMVLKPGVGADPAHRLWQTPGSMNAQKPTLGPSVHGAAANGRNLGAEKPPAAPVPGPPFMTDDDWLPMQGSTPSARVAPPIGKPMSSTVADPFAGLSLNQAPAPAKRLDPFEDLAQQHVQHKAGGHTQPSLL